MMQILNNKIKVLFFKFKSQNTIFKHIFLLLKKN